MATVTDTKGDLSDIVPALETLFLDKGEQLYIATSEEDDVLEAIERYRHHLLACATS